MKYKVKIDNIIVSKIIDSLYTYYDNFQKDFKRNSTLSQESVKVIFGEEVITASKNKIQQLKL